MNNVATDEPVLAGGPAAGSIQMTGHAAHGDSLEFKPDLDLSDFERLDLRIGKVRVANPVEGSECQMLLQVDVGTEIRPVLAAIKSRYSPQDLVGQRVVLLCNVKPTNQHGVVSHGMVLTAVEGDHLSLITSFDKAPRGARIR